MFGVAIVETLGYSEFYKGLSTLACERPVVVCLAVIFGVYVTLLTRLAKRTTGYIALDGIHDLAYVGLGVLPGMWVAMANIIGRNASVWSENARMEVAAIGMLCLMNVAGNCVLRSLQWVSGRNDSNSTASMPRRIQPETGMKRWWMAEELCKVGTFLDVGLITWFFGAILLMRLVQYSGGQ